MTDALQKVSEAIELSRCGLLDVLDDADPVEIIVAVDLLLRVKKLKNDVDALLKACIMKNTKED